MTQLLLIVFIGVIPVHGDQPRLAFALELLKFLSRTFELQSAIYY